MPFLLIVFLTLACLPEVGSGWPHPFWTSSPALAGLLTWLTVALLVGWAWWTSRRTCRGVARDPSRREYFLRRYERMRWTYQFALMGAYVGMLCLCGWGWAVGELWARTVIDPESPQHPFRVALHGAELLILAPFLTAMILSWACFYDAEQAAQAATHPSSPDHLLSALLEEEAALRSTAGPTYGGRWSYVLFKFRNTLVMVFVPLLLLVGQKELFRFFPDLVREWGDLVAGLGVLMVLTVFASLPWVFRLVLNLKPLPDGPLRRRLLATAKRMDFRCSEIMLWNTRDSMANAMVVGILPWLRYVVFTDRLLEEFTEDEVEAVFGHEMGHVKHHHMAYYFAFLMASMMVLALMISFLLGGKQTEGPPTAVSTQAPVEAAPVPGDFMNLSSHEYLRQAPLMLLLLVYVFVVFGFVSRRCERQADIYGCRAVSCSRPDCLMHDRDVVLASHGKGLCRTGVRIFIQALDKVALLNGISREKPGYLQSWQHSTIARRVAFLQAMLTDATLEPRFQRRLLLVKCGLFVVLGMVLVVLGLVGFKFTGLG
jgi:STE24 endopeptidase